jgi:hypothetical protein
MYQGYMYTMLDGLLVLMYTPEIRLTFEYATNRLSSPTPPTRYPSPTTAVCIALRRLARTVGSSRCGNWESMMMPAMVTKRALLGSEEGQYIQYVSRLTSYHCSPYEVYSCISSAYIWGRVYQYECGHCNEPTLVAQGLSPPAYILR